MVPGVVMNLSKFYNINDGFQPKAVLETTVPPDKEPVWESIVKDEAIPPEDISEATISDTPDIDSDQKIVTDTPQAEETVFDNAPVDHKATIKDSPPPPPPEPSIDVEAIRDNAFTSGIAAGRQQAEEDFENSAQTLLCICNELDTLRETILQNSAEEMKELVLAISEKIIRHSVAEQEETIVATIKDAIHLAVKSDEYLIQVNPDDLKAVTSRKQEIINSINGLDNIVLKPDTTIEKGGCKLESNSCTIDASMASQIKIIHDTLLTSDRLSDTRETEESI